MPQARTLRRSLCEEVHVLDIFGLHYSSLLHVSYLMLYLQLSTRALTKLDGSLSRLYSADCMQSCGWQTLDGEPMLDSIRRILKM